MNFFKFQEAAFDADKVFLAAIDKFDAMMSKGNVYAPDGMLCFSPSQISDFMMRIFITATTYVLQLQILLSFTLKQKNLWTQSIEKISCEE